MLSSLHFFSQTVTLKADMTGVANWQPQWAEMIIEGYSVTQCSQLSCGIMGGFTEIMMSTTLEPSAPLIWSAPFYEIDGGNQASAQCAGTTNFTAKGDAVNVFYNCKAPH